MSQLLERCLTEGEEAYSGAAYGIAYVQWLMGRVLKRGGAAEAALSPLSEARQRFQTLADDGDSDAERMVSVALGDSADCLKDLGRLDEAVNTYEESIRRAEKLEDRRQVAVIRAQLGTARIRQHRYSDALAAYHDAREVFEALGEPGSVAAAWHQIGMVHRYAGQTEEAENSYRQSLAIKVREKYRAGEASSLNELGNLYDQMGLLEESVTFYRQAADIYSELADMFHKGSVHGNLADALLKLRRHNEARGEIRRAIECKKRFGHAAELWKAWSILHDLETATGNPEAAADARQKAIQAFLAYRRGGGENQDLGAKLCDLVANAIRSNDRAQARQQLDRLSGPDVEPRARAMIPKLHAILDGDRNPTLADYPDLLYTHAAELQLLLERLQQE